MKKYFLLTALIILSQCQKLVAQVLFTAPDTVCVNQPVKLINNFTTGSTYYWGFCSGNLLQTPTSVPPRGFNLGDNFGFELPGNIDVVKDSDQNYYGFAVNSMTTEFIRLNYGKSLNNVPTVTNFGNLTGGLPVNPTSLYIVRDSAAHRWHIFVSGGYTQATSTLARLDFGTKLDNPSPNIANFGNHTGLLDYPKGIFIAKEADGNWWGYVVNRNTSELIRMDFSFNVSNTPLMMNAANPLGVMNQPSDLAALRDNGKWYLFVTNYGSNTVARIDLGTTLNPPLYNTAVNLGNFAFRILQPSAISINRDCGGIYAYITDSSTSQLISLQMPAAIGPYSAIDYNNVGLMNYPSGISSIIRDGDNLYGFITNTKDSTLTQIVFPLCTSSSIPSFSEVDPPVYHYNTPGNYNVYYVVDQGLPTMQVDCKTITVIAPPPMFRSPDTTICKNDTIRLYVSSNLADSIKWLTNYNSDTTFTLSDSVLVAPGFDTFYRVKLYYSFGCIVDTGIKVDVRYVVADAGPDRVIRDGATSALGGPFTTIGAYTYHWSPYQFMADSSVPNAVVYPPQSMTYYLKVTDGAGCSDIDTVLVNVNCGDFNVPNAFAPNSANDRSNRFGILNYQIAKLNYFRIYNRWGEMVFETTNPAQKWDGTYNGNLAPEGVYVWEADAFCTSGVKITKRGNVTLLR